MIRTSPPADLASLLHQQQQLGKTVATQWAPGSASDVVVPTSETDLSVGNTEVTFIGPESGKVLVTLYGYVAMSGTGQVL